MRKLVHLLVLVCLLTASAAAATPAPVPGPPASVAVLFVNPQGAWDRTVQESFESLGFKKESGVAWISWRHLLDGGRLASLAPARQEALLRFPQLLLEAQRRPPLTTVRYVVLATLRAPGSGRMEAIMRDTASGEPAILPEIRTGDRARAMALLSDAVAQTLRLQTEPVWGDIHSHQYHVVDCNHVRPDGVILIPSAAEARRYGYHPCAVCFPDRGGAHRDRVELALGREVSSYIESRYGLDADAKRRARVERVGRRLAAANHLDDFEYSFGVLKSDELNALSAGAGHVYITRGLEKLTEGNDDELAVILGHEIGHCELHHVVREYREAQTWSLIGAVISVATGTNLGGLLANFAGDLVSRGHSRSFEAQADHAGLIYAYGAGYQPEDFALVLNAFKRLEKGKSQPPAWLRTHPSNDRRLQNAAAECAELKAYDEVVRGYQAIDPGMAEALRGHAFELLPEEKALAQEQPLWLSALGPGAPTIGAKSAPPADDRPPLVLPPGPAAPETPPAAPADTLPTVRND